MGPFPTDFGGKHWPEPIPPKPDRFMANIDAAFMQKILHIPKRKRETDVEHHRQTDDFGTGFEVAKRRVFCHPVKLQSRPARLKPVSSDSTLRAAVKVLEGVAFAHAETLRNHPARLNRIPSDKTLFVYHTRFPAHAEIFSWRH
jgi:hypothetical protein